MSRGGRLRRVGRAARVGAFDWVVAGAVAALTYGLHGFQGAVTRDLGIFLYGAERVADGRPPYVANFNTVGPLADAVPGFAVWCGRLVGVGPVFSARFLYFIISVASCALVAVYARRLTGSRIGGLLGAALFLTFETFLDLATNGPRDKTAMVLFLVAGLLLLSHRRWAWAGVATALATLTWQPAILPMVAATVVMLVPEPSRWRSGARFLAGGAATAALALLWFVTEGAVSTAIKGFLTVNLRWVRQPSAFASPEGTWRLLWEGYHVSLVVALGGVAGLIVLALRRRQRAMVRACAAGAAVSVVWTASAINGAPDLLVVLPFGAVGAAAVLARVGRAAGRSGPVVLAVVGALAVGYALSSSVTTRSHDLLIQARDVKAVLRVLPARGGVAVVDAPQPLVFSGRTNPQPYLILDSGEIGLFRAEMPGGLVGYLDSLLATHPALLAIGPGRYDALILDVVDKSFVHAGRGAGWDWWVSKDSGAQLVKQVRRANRRALVAARRDLQSR